MLVGKGSDRPGAVTGSNPVNFGVRRQSARRPLLGGVEREQMYLAELGAPSRRPGSALMLRRTLSITGTPSVGLGIMQGR